MAQRITIVLHTCHVQVHMYFNDVHWNRRSILWCSICTGLSHKRSCGEGKLIGGYLAIHRWSMFHASFDTGLLMLATSILKKTLHTFHHEHATHLVDCCCTKLDVLLVEGDAVQQRLDAFTGPTPWRMRLDDCSNADNEPTCSNICTRQDLAAMDVVMRFQEQKGPTLVRQQSKRGLSAKNQQDFVSNVGWIRANAKWMLLIGTSARHGSYPFW